MVESGKVTLTLDDLDPFVGYIAPVRESDEGVIQIGLIDKSITADAARLGHPFALQGLDFESHLTLDMRQPSRDEENPSLIWVYANFG